MLGECMSRDLGVIVLAPMKVASILRDRFPDEIGSRIWLLETDHPHDLKFVNPANKDQAYVWVASCT